MKPSTVNVLGHEYAVEWLDAVINQKTQAEMDGYISYSDMTIQVCTDTPTRRQPTILTHEILHALLHVTGHSDYAQDEDLVECLAYGLTAILRANPEFVRYLVGGES